ncbi:hypothetical protein, partial [uncultured Parvibaculum sp.]|uniref:hypothetical protein n=2 Tax=Parvibaculum TaxID=256616 RepID=UPI0030DCD17A
SICGSPARPRAGKKSVCLHMDEKIIAAVDAVAAPGENRSEAVQRLISAALGRDTRSDHREPVLKT